jgi:hypothetical protein
MSVGQIADVYVTASYFITSDSPTILRVCTPLTVVSGWTSAHRVHGAWWT